MHAVVWLEHSSEATYDDRFLCRCIDAEAVVYTASYHPYDILSAAEHILLPFQMERYLAIGKVVAQFFAPFHAEGDKPVPLATEAQGEGVFQLGCIEAGYLG